MLLINNSEGRTMRDLTQIKNPSRSTKRHSYKNTYKKSVLTLVSMFSSKNNPVHKANSQSKLWAPTCTSTLFVFLSLFPQNSVNGSPINSKILKISLLSKHGTSKGLINSLKSRKIIYVICRLIIVRNQGKALLWFNGELRRGLFWKISIRERNKKRNMKR